MRFYAMTGLRLLDGKSIKLEHGVFGMLYHQPCVERAHIESSIAVIKSLLRPTTKPEVVPTYAQLRTMTKPTPIQRLDRKGMAKVAYLPYPHSITPALFGLYETFVHKDGLGNSITDTAFNHGPGFSFVGEDDANQSRYAGFFKRLESKLFKTAGLYEERHIGEAGVQITHIGTLISTSFLEKTLHVLEKHLAEIYAEETKAAQQQEREVSEQFITAFVESQPAPEAPREPEPAAQPSKRLVTAKAHQRGNTDTRWEQIDPYKVLADVDDIFFSVQTYDGVPPDVVPTRTPGLSTPRNGRSGTSLSGAPHESSVRPRNELGGTVAFMKRRDFDRTIQPMRWAARWVRKIEGRPTGHKLPDITKLTVSQFADVPGLVLQARAADIIFSDMLDEEQKPMVLTAFPSHWLEKLADIDAAADFATPADPIFHQTQDEEPEQGK